VEAGQLCYSRPKVKLLLLLQMVLGRQVVCWVVMVAGKQA
jgi:hypothetical protein